MRDDTGAHVQALGNPFDGDPIRPPTGLAALSVVVCYKHVAPLGLAPFRGGCGLP